MHIASKIKQATITAALLAISLAIMVPAIAYSKDTPNTSPENLERSEWMVTHIDGFDADEAATSTIHFELATEVKGQAGCNQYTAEATVGADGALSFGSVTADKRTCLNPRITASQNAYLTALGKTKSFAINFNVLRFYDSDGKELIKFRRLGTVF